MDLRDEVIMMHDEQFLTEEEIAIALCQDLYTIRCILAHR